MDSDAIILEAASRAVYAARQYLEACETPNAFENLKDSVFWAFVKLWENRIHSPLIKIIDFEGLLYPDNPGDFNGQVIPKEIAEVIIGRAQYVLEAETKGQLSLPDRVRDHLQDIINNGMPYGVIAEDYSNVEA